MKKRVLVKGPALSLSGYGEQARFALRSLREHEDKFELFLQNIPWGKTGHLISDSEETRWLHFLNMKTQQYLQNKGQFDVSIQVTIPNEFEKIAPVNIGYTAGIETTKVSPHWIDKARLMDKIIVVSNHSKTVFDNTEYKLKNEQTGQIIDFRNTTAIDVIHFPVKNLEKKEINLDLKTNFNFLSVAQWGPRKNVEATIVAFLKEFKNDSDVGLVLKLNVAKNCIADKLACENRIENIKKTVPDAKCKIYLLHGNMTDEELNSVYTHPKIKAIVSTTHGEGFGLPLFEAVCSGLPVIAPKWSGHVDFLLAPVKEDGKERMRNHFTTIEFELANVNKEAVWEGVIQADSQWCFVKEFSAMDAMRKVYKNHSGALSTARKLKEYVLEQFSENKQKELFFNTLGIFKKPKSIEPKQVDGLTFCIPSNGKRIEKTLLTIQSIKKQKWSNIPYEIIVCGNIEPFIQVDGISLIDKKEEANSRKVSVLRNAAADKAKFDNIVFCDDDIILANDWLENTLEYSKEFGWEILGNKILNPDGTRHWDKATLNPRKLVDYGHPDNDTNLMQTSGFFLIRKDVFAKVRWDENKLVYADRDLNQIPEDVQFNLDIYKNNFELRFNKNCLVWHNDDSYTEFSGQTLKKQTISEITGLEFFPKQSKILSSLIEEIK